MNVFTVDISQHLEDAPKFLKLGPGDENVLRVNDKKNTVLKIQEIINKDTSDKSIEKALTLAVGEEGVKKINEMDISYSAYQAIFIGVMAAILGQTYEETKKNFFRNDGN